MPSAASRALQIAHDVPGRVGIDEALRPDLHGGRAGQEKLDRVGRVLDAADARDRQRHAGAVDLVDHAQRDRLDRRARQARRRSSRSSGRRVRASMAMPVMVLMIDSPSAPPSAQARASATMSDVLGVSLIQSGFLTTARQARTRSASTRGSVPNSMPPALMFGHETFISRRVDAVEAVQAGAARRRIRRTWCRRS